MKESTFTIAYATVFWNHYQAAICREIANLLGPDRFKMCIIEPLEEERRALKWESAPPTREWIIPPPENQDERNRISQIMCDSDVAVMGSLGVEQSWYDIRLRNYNSPQKLDSAIRCMLACRYTKEIWHGSKHAQTLRCCI